MELREKIARQSFLTYRRHGRRLTEDSAWDALAEYEQSYWLAVADAILELPEIKGALACWTGGSLTVEKRLGLRK
jgi:hypothetical protein